MKQVTLPTRKFFFIRHGETEYNRQSRFQGQINVPLNKKGHTQASRASDILARVGISLAVTSPATRVRQTLAPFIRHSQLQLHVEEQLLEMSVGSFEGRLYSEVRKEHALEEDESWLSILPEDAESWRDFVNRVVGAVARWTEKNPYETILFASHGLVFRALSQYLKGTAMQSGNAQVHIFEPSSTVWNITPVN